MSEQKARPVNPPTFDPHFEAQIVDVDMTRVYITLGLLTASTTALTASSVWLWRKVRHTEQSMEALSEYVSRLVNNTDCGKVAYQTLLDDVERDETIPDWSDDEEVPYPTQQHLTDEYPRI